MSSIKSSTKNFLNPCSLRFSGENIEKEYQKMNLSKSRKANIIISIINFIVSLSLVIMTIVIFQNSKAKSELLGLKLQFINQTMMSEINQNKSNLSHDHVFFRKFFFVNETATNLGQPLELSLMSVKNREMLNLANGLYQGLGVMIILIILLGIFLTFGILACSVKNQNCQRILFCLLILFFSLPYNMFSGILYVSFELEGEAMYFPLLLEIFLFFLICFKLNSDWLLFTIFNSIGLLIEIIVYSAIILGTQQMMYFIAFYIMLKFLIIFFSYFIERKIKYEFFLRRHLSNERAYLLSLIENFQQGFITYNKNVLFVNYYMRKIIKDFSSNEKTESFYEKLLEKYFFSGKETENNLNNVIVPFSEKDYLNDVNREFFVGKILRSNVKDETKIILEKIFRCLKEVSPLLPENVIKSLKKGSTRESNLLDNLFQTIVDQYSYEDEESLNFNNNFRNLGRLEIELEEKQVKNYLVSYRLITHNFNEKFVEFIFIDITKEKVPALVKNESQIIKSNPTYNYDSKLAAELPNSLECIFELSRFILVESRAENSQENIPMIMESAEYINKLCRVSKELLSDYNLIKTTKFSCQTKCGLAHLKSCPICGVFKFCESCAVCKNCDKKKETTFDLPELTENIIDLFRTISKHEYDYDSPFFSEIYENEEDFESKLITTNKQLLTSVFFNIFFFSLRNTKKKSEIKLKVKRGITKNNFVSTYFQISDLSQIEKGYLKIFKDNEEKKVTNDDENGKKYFEISLAYSLVKKLGSKLEISSNEEGSIYIFELSEPYTPKEEYFFPKRKIRSQKNKLLEVNNDDTILVELPNFNNEPIFFKNYKPKKIQDFKSEVEDQEYISPKFASNLEFENITKPENNNKFEKTVIPVSSSLKRILIVVSSTQSKDLLLKNLNNLNDSDEIEILKSETGYEALNKINEEVSQGKKIDIIFTEEEMPKLKLANFTKLIREIYSETLENEDNNLPFVVCISSSVAKQKELISLSGVDAVLKKDQITDLKKLFKDLLPGK
jgi:hypothetical protein